MTQYLHKSDSVPISEVHSIKHQFDSPSDIYNAQRLKNEFTIEDCDFLSNARTFYYSGTSCTAMVLVLLEIE
jgi:hypothetical protein